MVQAPVQDRGHLQMPELVKFAADRPAAKSQIVGARDQIVEPGSTKGDGKPSAKLGKVLPATICQRNGRQAGDPALCGFRLQYAGSTHDCPQMTPNHLKGD